MLLAQDVVIGFAAGLLSAVAMTLFEIPFWVSRGMGWVVEWQVNQILVSKLLQTRFSGSPGLGPALASHLLHGLVAGGVLASILVLSGANNSNFLAAGILYSLLLWTAVPSLFRRPLESAGGIQFTRTGLGVSFASHLVYGLALGGLLSAFLK